MDEEPADADRPAVRFRNYAPKDATLEGGQGSASADADAGITSNMDVDGDSGAPMTKRQRTENSASSSGGGGKKGEKPISALEEAMLQAKAEASALTGGGVGGDGAGGAAVAGGALASLAPQKVNADLKRDIKGKLDRLERRTQRALVDLLKERLEKEAEEGDDGLD
eukprot:CAMPEP_0181035438 /NCGR_PEP_ID=MMETSP1070-20121207/8321_1 /TAXON_ID=265543 /ORGANISM="Minutocellus polymorphus, Strain NH13" /LENGTH=166 /DNA_ID=CAMNT_0023112993 /DNA_START=27 /DNA_END=527 /DNA_ORIENTATION=+